MAKSCVGEVVFSKPFGFLERGSDIEGALKKGLQFAVYFAILCYFPQIIGLLVSPFVSSLKILPYDYIATKAAEAFNERKANPDARYDYVAHWLKAHEAQPDKLSAKDIQAAVTSNVR